MTVLNMRGEWRLDKGMFAVTGRNGLDTFFAKPGDRFYHRKLKKTGTVVRLEKLCQWDFLTESWVWREYLDPVANDTAYARIRMHWDGEPNDYGDDCEVEDVQNLIGEGAEPLPLTGRAGQIQAAMRPLKENEPVLESRYIVEGLLDRGAFSTAYGAPGSGKTFAMLEMAIHVAARREWRGLRVGGQDTEYDWPGPVVYIALEGGRGIRNRLAALKIEKPDVFAAAAEDDMFTAISLPLDFHAEGDAEALLEVFGTLTTPPGLIVIDTLARAMGSGDENSAAEMGRFIRNIDKVRERTGAHVMVVHHSGKDATRGARGSSALNAALDTEIEVVQVHGVITIADRKQREAERGFERHFTLKQVVLGMDENGKPVTSAVLMDAEAVQKKTRLTGSQEVALNALTDALVQHGKQMADTVNYPARDVVSEDDWRAMCDRHGLTGTDTPEAKRKAFTRARDSLMKKNIVRHFDGMVWRVQPNEM